jgi:DMSO/TMAO reductase YedYZ molybdopterin-dependent catalytic subunit
MIVRSVRPEDLEMPLSGFDHSITPVEQFFVRTHVMVPEVDVRTWRLRVEGEVSTPLTLSMGDLRRMKSVELVGVLECAGNGRSFFTPRAAGLQWVSGAVGNGRWRGVRLKDVLNRAGIKDGAVEVLADGADIPLGTMADFQRSIPIAKAMHPDTLLAYELNGGPLPSKHGFPLRLVVPGWAGDSWAKWVTSLRVLREKSTSFWMASAYRYPQSPVAPGTAVAADAMVPLTSLAVKSAIASPLPGTKVEVGRPISIRGAAWSGEAGPVTGVDVSVDGGRTWRPAKLKGDGTRYGWRLWETSWTPGSDGQHTVLARARDAGGTIQPMTAQWNPSGYLWNAAARADIYAGDAAVPVAGGEVAAGEPAPEVLSTTCGSCHEGDVIRQQRLTRGQWERELDKMGNWGARLDAKGRNELLDYLAGHYGPER